MYYFDTVIANPPNHDLMIENQFLILSWSIHLRYSEQAMNSTKLISTPDLNCGSSLI